MKILKKILIVLVAVIAILLVGSLFLSSDVMIERNLTIKASPETVFEQVNTLKNWEKWSPWKKEDPEMKIVYKGPEKGVGSSYSWNGPKMSEGTLTILRSQPYDSVIYELAMKGMKPAESGFHLTKEKDGTMLSWYMKTNIGSNPMMKWMMMLMHGAMEHQFDMGLADIKKIAESMPPVESNNSMQVEEKAVIPTPYLAYHDTASLATIGMKLGHAYGEIGKVAGKQQLKQQGPVFAIYYTDSQTNFEFDACVPVNKSGKSDGAVKAGELKAGNSVVVHFYGPYTQTPKAHEAAHEYIKAHNKQITGAPYEIYVTDPMMEKDSMKWLTEVCYPVQ